MTQATALMLVRQRDDLIAKIDIERAAIVQHGASLQKLSRMIDKVRGGIQYLKRHPETLLLPVVVTAMARPWRLLALAISGFGLWRMAHGLRRRILS